MGICDVSSDCHRTDLLDWLVVLALDALTCESYLAEQSIVKFVLYRTLSDDWLHNDAVDPLRLVGKEGQAFALTNLS